MAGKSEGRVDQAAASAAIRDRLGRPVALMRAGRFDEALAEAEALLKVAPESALVHNLLAAIYAAQQRLELTVLSLKRALSIEPDFPPALNNLGFALTGLGKPAEALAPLRRAVALAPDYAEAHNNLGLVLHQLDKHADGIASFRRALAIRPTYADAHNNVGKALIAAGEADEAIMSHRAAISIDKANAGFHDSLGVTLSLAGKHEEALGSFRTAVSLRPGDARLRDRLGNALALAGDYAGAEPHLHAAIAANPENAWTHFRYAEVLTALDRPGPAIAHYLAAVQRVSDEATFWDRLASHLATLEFGGFEQTAAEALTQVLERGDIIPPRLLVRPAVTLAKHHPLIRRALDFQEAETIGPHIKEVCHALNETPFLLKILSLTPVHDEAMERLVSDVRCAILLNRRDLGDDPQALRVQVALALHAFATEYILDELPAESAELENIQTEISAGRAADALAIACLAAYRPLHQYEWRAGQPVPAALAELFARQVTEVLEERRIREQIVSFAAVTDATSAAVRAQYEENPYPRWQSTRVGTRPGSLEELAAEWRLDILPDTKFSDEPAVLIAGCGTGQHAVGAAATYRNSRVTAIDLSLNSLAYATRKAGEHNLTNLQFMQGDLLEAERLGQKFDVIESVGVLHHVAEPLRGWRVLRGCLKPRGLMAIGLYSTLARKPVAAARAEIAKRGFSARDIRAFRAALFSGEIKFDGDHIVRQSPDFYAMSECRDLLFHVQEHTFTIPQIKEALEELRLRFIGFEFLSKLTIERFQHDHTQQRAIYPLDAWQEFEAKWPNTFSAMYKFWVQAE